MPMLDAYIPEGALSPTAEREPGVPYPFGDQEETIR